MPNLTFVLPHWLYWSGLLLFPLLALYMASRPSARDALGRPTLGVGYLTLVTAGFPCIWALITGVECPL